MNWALAGIAIFVITLLGIGAYFIISPAEPLIITFNASITPKNVMLGKTTQATFNIDSNKAASATIRYLLISRTGKTILSETQQFELDGPTSKTYTLTIPTNAQTGPYWLRARLSSDDLQISALAGLIITPAPAQPRQPKQPKTPALNQTLPSTPATLDTPPSQPPESPSSLNQTESTSLPETNEPQSPTTPVSEPSPQPTTPQPLPATPPPSTTGAPPLSPDEILTNARNLAASNPAAAAEQCTPLQPTDRDTCLSEVALAGRLVGGSTICSRITDVPSKDACLANLALAGDFSVCNAITNTDIKDSCLALKGKTT